MNNALSTKISIVTIVRNDPEGLEKTILSVIGQTYGNIEFIVIDGASTDGTVDVIKKYAHKLDYWVSEKDGGVYDAMNKGIRKATGVWVNFMNAGDTFAGADVLERIDWDAFRDSALVYGGKIFKARQYAPVDIAALRYGEIMACHQSMFFNKQILKEALIYDTSLPIYSDYELVNRIYVQGYPMSRVDIAVADYAEGGISEAASTQKRKDKYKTLYKYYGLPGIVRGVWYRVSKVFKG